MFLLIQELFIIEWILIVGLGFVLGVGAGGM